jgi:hypothetical protein
VLAQELGVQAHVARFVHTVHVSERRRDREVGADLRERGVDVVDILRLGVELGVVNAGVVHAVLLATGDANLHLEPEANLRHALKVLDTGRDVVLLGLFGEIEHVRREERLLVQLVVLLVSLEHAIEPWEQLVRAVVRMENNGAR